MQWWFSPHFYDAIFWASTLFVVGYWFFRAQGWKKWAFTLLAIASLDGFVLALFRFFAGSLRTARLLPNVRLSLSVIKMSWNGKRATSGT